MSLVYGSVCSGIEAASVAWHPLGFRPAWFAEIAEFPSAVLAYRWPHIPNLGDFTRIGVDESPPEPVDVLVGGTPCQSFSDAGGRAGLDDPRGVLALEFLRLAARLRARWVVWENVRGVFSSDDGSAFATIIGLLVELGYGVAWRMLDLQFFGAPQRRRRVFVVGYLGDWRPPVAVLLERPSLRRDPRARSPAGSSVAAAPGVGVDADGVSHTLTAHHGRNSCEDVFVISPTIRTAGRSAGPATQGPISSLDCAPSISAEATGAIAVLPIQEAQRSSASRQRRQNGMGVGAPNDPMYTITTRGDHAVFAFDQAQITSPDNRATVAVGSPVPSVAKSSRVTVAGPELCPRRLTPLEVERCFGFPDHYTAIPGASDSARYEALGNSKGVPVVRWIGERLLFVDGVVRRAG